MYHTFYLLRKYTLPPVRVCVPLDVVSSVGVKVTKRSLFVLCRKQLPPPEHISECSDVSDGYEEEEEVPVVTSPETGLDAVNGVQPELQRTEQESVLASKFPPEHKDLRLPVEPFL